MQNTSIFGWLCSGTDPLVSSFYYLHRKKFVVTSILEFLEVLMTVNFCFLFFSQGR